MKRAVALRSLIVLTSVLYLVDYWLVTWWRDELPIGEIARGFFLGGSPVNRLLWRADAHTVLGVAFHLAMLIVVAVALLPASRRGGEAPVGTTPDGDPADPGDVWTPASS